MEAKEGEIKIQPNGIKTITLNLPLKGDNGEWYQFLYDVPICYGKADTHIREYIGVDDSKAVNMYKHSLECGSCSLRDSCHSLSKIDQLDSLKRILKVNDGFNRVSK